MAIIDALVGGAIGAHSAKKQTHDAKMAAIDSREYNTEVLKSQHRWEVADLRNAGLNPILSAGGQGTGTGSTGQVAQVADTGSSISKGAQVAASLRNTMADTALKTAGASSAHAQARVQNNIADVSKPLANMATGVHSLSAKAASAAKRNIRDISHPLQTFKRAKQSAKARNYKPTTSVFNTLKSGYAKWKKGK